MPEAFDDMEVEEVEQVPLPYSQRPEWADVAPVLVDDGNCVVAIQYTAHHREALSYFRAVLATGEKSARVLQLTGDMISLNQADYTAWQWRWLCVEALNSDLTVEYQLCSDVMKDNAKNYQLWNHRRKCALRAGPSSAEAELDFSMLALEIDEKNYHAWAHRLAIVQAFGLWEKELDFVEEMVKRDVRNNSAWNQRGYVVKHMLEAAASQGTIGMDADVQPDSCSTASGTGLQVPGPSVALLHDLLRRELAYVEQQVLRAPRNESAWNYLSGLFSLPGCHPLEMARWTKVHAICMAALSQAPSCPPALALLSDYYVATARAALQHAKALGADCAGDRQQGEAALQSVRASVRHAGTLLDGLTFADPIRTMYWVHRHQVLQQLLADAAAAEAR